MLNTRGSTHMQPALRSGGSGGPTASRSRKVEEDELPVLATCALTRSTAA